MSTQEMPKSFNDETNLHSPTKMVEIAVKRIIRVS